MNHKAFWEKYITIASDEEARVFLKNYLFSLPPMEMKKWILSEAQSIMAELKHQLNDPSVDDMWKKETKEKLQSAFVNIENLKKICIARGKAA